MSALIFIGFIGPTLKAKAGKDDALIRTNINRIKISVNSYINKNSRVISDLSEVSLSAKPQRLVGQGLVWIIDDNNSRPTNNSGLQNDKRYVYQLCATFKQKVKLAATGPLIILIHRS